MNAQDMLDELRAQTYTDTNTLPDPSGLRYLNFSYKRIYGRMKSDNNQDIASEIWATNSVAYQSEYLWPVNSGNFIGASNVLGISVNYVTPTPGDGTVSINSGSRTMTGVGTTFTSLIGKTIDTGSFRGVVVAASSDTSCTLDSVSPNTISGSMFNWYTDNWKKATEMRIVNFDNDESWYRANASEGSPYFAVYDNSYFIFPYTKQSVTGAIKFYGLRSVPDLVLSPSPTSPIIDPDLHYAIVVGAKKWVYQRRGQLEQYQEMAQDDNETIRDTLHISSDRNLASRERENPTLGYFE